MGFGLPLRGGTYRIADIGVELEPRLERKLFVCDIADQRMLELDPSVGAHIEEGIEPPERPEPGLRGDGGQHPAGVVGVELVSEDGNPPQKVAVC